MPSFALQLIGAVFVIVGFATRHLHDTPVNKVIGYRTKRSMANEETWQEGNKTFGRCLSMAGIVDFIAGTLTLQRESLITALANAVIFLAGLGLSIYLTESRLKARFEP